MSTLVSLLVLYGILILAYVLIQAYFLGSIPFGYIISRLKGIPDIRETGSGSTGGTNVSRKLGPGWGLLVGFLDCLKSFTAILIALGIFGGVNIVVFFVLIFAVLGHIFPVWLKFRAGKGVASVVGGLFLVINPIFLLIGAALWLIIFFPTRYISLANLVVLLFLPLALWFSHYSIPYVVLGFLLFCIIIWAHRENVVRLKKGTESKFNFKQIKN